MSAKPLWAVEWRAGGQTLIALEPTEAEILRAAGELAEHYNDAHNRQMMGHGDEPFTAAAVAAYYRASRGEGGRPFLFQRGGVLIGDGDLRNIEDASAEIAIMIGARDVQGRGLGTLYATMLHVFAFRVLGLERLYVSVIPDNAASRRLFGKLGYEADDSSEARALIDEETDLTLSVSRSKFESTATGALSEIRIYPRETPLLD
jgi:RimJ/RimL family protein N-acetyltransferase